MGIKQAIKFIHNRFKYESELVSVMCDTGPFNKAQFDAMDAETKVLIAEDLKSKPSHFFM